MFSTILDQPTLSAQPQRVLEQEEEKPCVLLIDDDDVHTDVLSRRLQGQGFSTLSADSGEVGLALAQREQPSVVLLDLNLPDTDGLQVCQALADSIDTCAIPVIIISAVEKPDLLRRCRSAGCHFFIRKPYDPNALLLLIRQAIRDCFE